MIHKALMALTSTIMVPEPGRAPKKLNKQNQQCLYETTTINQASS